jgi:hypothetical protein
MTTAKWTILSYILKQTWCPSVRLCGQKLGSVGADRAGQGRAAGQGSRAGAG